MAAAQVVRLKVLAEVSPEYMELEDGSEAPVLDPASLPKDERARLIKQIEKEMKDAAQAMEFERAAVDLLHIAPRVDVRLEAELGARPHRCTQQVAGAEVHQVVGGNEPSSFQVGGEANLDRRASEIPLGFYAGPEDVTPLVLFLAGDEARYITGQVIAVDGGDIVSTTAPWLQTSSAGHVLDPGPFGTLGTGAPFALAAKAVFPDKEVGIVYGDGGFGFNGMEYDTFVRLGLPIVGVVGNDGVWNNIKSFHRMFYPDRLVATDLGRRPYHAMVEALGGHGELVTRSKELVPALERAAASGLPALVNVHIDETFRASSNYSG